MKDIMGMMKAASEMKGKMEAMVQTVVSAQELWLKAALVDREALAVLQDCCELVQAEETLRAAFWQDVRPLVAAWRVARGLPEDPLQALRASGYVERISKERAGKQPTGGSYA